MFVFVVQNVLLLPNLCTDYCHTFQHIALNTAKPCCCHETGQKPGLVYSLGWSVVLLMRRVHFINVSRSAFIGIIANELPMICIFWSNKCSQDQFGHCMIKNLCFYFGCRKAAKNMLVELTTRINFILHLPFIRWW